MSHSTQPWPQHEIDKVVELRRKGLSYAQIGPHLDRSESAVREKCRRLREDGWDIPRTVGERGVNSPDNAVPVPVSSTSFDITDWSLTGLLMGDPHPSRSALGRRE